MITETLAFVGKPERLTRPKRVDAVAIPIVAMLADDLTVEKVGIATCDLVLDLLGDRLIQPRRELE